MHLRLVPILLLALSAAPPAWAQVHKCTDAGGRVSYSDLPCVTVPATGARAATPAPTASRGSSAVTSPSVAAVPARPVPSVAASGSGSASTVSAASRPAASEIDADLAARQAAAAQTADCGAALRQMGTAGAGMRLVEAGHARGAALSRCGGG